LRQAKEKSKENYSDVAKIFTKNKVYFLDIFARKKSSESKL